MRDIIRIQKSNFTYRTCVPYLSSTVRLERINRLKVRRYGTLAKFVFVTLRYYGTINFWSTSC